jgi:hypothetical protein
MNESKWWYAFWTAWIIVSLVVGVWYEYSLLAAGDIVMGAFAGMIAFAICGCGLLMISEIRI